MWAAQAAVLGKADTAVRNKLSPFDLADRSLHKAPELLTLLFRDRSPHILNLGSMLPDEDDQCHFRNPTDPRITDELWIERKQSFGFRRMPTRCCLPDDQAVLAIDLSEGIEIGNEFASSRHCLANGPGLDRLLRYEASLERTLDRTLSQLERLQRMRLGQPVLPKLEVRHSES